MARGENIVESYLNKEIKKLGGITRKWVSPGRDGVPDRICILHGAVFFVEVKTLNGKLSKRQEREAAELQSHGAKVYTLKGKESVDILVDLIIRGVMYDPS